MAAIPLIDVANRQQLAAWARELRAQGAAAGIMLSLDEAGAIYLHPSGRVEDPAQVRRLLRFALDRLSDDEEESA